MNYFHHAKNRQKDIRLLVWQILNTHIPLAIREFKGNWEDALIESYIHIVNNYDESKGDIEVYSKSILTTLYKREYFKNTFKELTNEEVLSARLDEDSEDLYSYILDRSDVLHEEKFNDCLNMILPYYIKDFKFFKNYELSEKKLDYSEIVEFQYPETVSEVVNYLKHNYDDSLGKLYSKKLECNFKDYAEDRYKASLDTAWSCEGILGNVILGKKINKKRIPTSVYRVSISELINQVLYNYRDVLYTEVEEVGVWMSFSGYVSYDLAEIKKRYEREIVGRLLSLRSNLKVIAYEQGCNLYLSSTKELPKMFWDSTLGREYFMKLELMTFKEV